MKYSYTPSSIKRKRKHGFFKRAKKHKKVLLRRMAKGRKRLSI